MDHRSRLALARALYCEVPRRVGWTDASAETRMKWVLRAQALGDNMEQKPSPWLRIVQALNGLAMTLLGAVVVVHQTYPGILTGFIQKLPPVIGIPAIFAFGLMVHLALRQAKKA